MATQGQERAKVFQWGCLGLLLGSIVLIVGAGIWLFATPPAMPQGPRPTAIVWTATPTLTPTPQPTPTPAPQMPDEMGIGARVRVSGTGTAGLNIRASAGTSAERLEIAAEGEIFLIVGGPIEADGLVWWMLRDEDQPTREGWAAANYLIWIVE